jgi:HAD superfamily hydrolase (TIGR01509 family)
MTLRALLWDLDGTLVDSEPAHAAAFDDAIAELGATVPEGFHDALLGASEDRVHAAMSAATGLDLDLDAWRAVKWEHFRRHGAGILRRSGVAELAEAWAARGLPSAVVSNSTADEVAFCLAATGLDTALPITVTRADVTRPKPDPQGYLTAAARLGIAPADCLAVEDSPLGIEAALAAGMRAIFHPQTPGATADPRAEHLAPGAALAPVLDRYLITGVPT